MQPQYLYHVSGNARVRINGKDYYLGKHGSQDSYARYHALLKQYVENDRAVRHDILKFSARVLAPHRPQRTQFHPID